MSGEEKHAGFRAGLHDPFPAEERSRLRFCVLTRAICRTERSEAPPEDRGPAAPAAGRRREGREPDTNRGSATYTLCAIWGALSPSFRMRNRDHCCTFPLAFL